MTNTNTTEWGNIELPGLSDEELFKKNWSQAARSKEQWQDPVYKNKVLSKIQSNEYRQHQSQILKNLAQTEEWQCKHYIGRQKAIANPDFGLKTSQGLKQALSTPQAKELKRNAMLNALEQDPSIGERRLISYYKTRNTPFVTTHGAFYSLKEAGLVFNKVRNFNNGAKWVRAQLKNKTPGFYYISWEEYSILTGKDI